MRRSLVVLAAVAMLSVLLAALAALMFPARAQDFPRVAWYGAAWSWGPPFTKPDGSLDSSIVRAVARHQLVAIPIATLDARPDIVLALRRARPDIKVLGYQLVTHWWLDRNVVPRADDTNLNASWQRALLATNGFLEGAPLGYEVDWSRRVVSDTLTSVLVRAVRMHTLDGVFLDYLAARIAWTGYSDATRDSARAANMGRMVNALRAAGGCGFLVYGNGGDVDARIDGQMREGFPGSLTSMTQALSQKRGDWLKSEGGYDGRPYTRESCRRARVVTAVACLTGAFACYGPSQDRTVVPFFGTWWFDEWSVTPLYRGGNRADTTGRYVDWLGDKGSVRTDSTGAVVGLFQHGAVMLNDTDAPVEVNLGRTYARIYGVRDPWTNNGQAAQRFIVPPHDALFVQLPRRVAP